MVWDLLYPCPQSCSSPHGSKTGFANAGSHQAEQAVWKLLSASRGESFLETASQTLICMQITWGHG